MSAKADVSSSGKVHQKLNVRQNLACKVYSHLMPTTDYSKLSEILLMKFRWQKGSWVFTFTHHINTVRCHGSDRNAISFLFFFKKPIKGPQQTHISHTFT